MVNINCHNQNWIGVTRTRTVNISTVGAITSSAYLIVKSFVKKKFLVVISYSLVELYNNSKATSDIYSYV